MTFLLTGATGQVGSIVARNLLDRGHRVRALVRDPGAAAARLGTDIEYVRGDLEPPGPSPDPLAGVAAASHAPATAREKRREDANFTEGAGGSGLPRLVALGV